MTVSSVTGTTPQSAQTTLAQQTLGQKDFLRLMTTQLTLQDPFDPVDNKEMIAQMAQFSSLSGINDVNNTLKAISAQLAEALGTNSTTGTAA